MAKRFTWQHVCEMALSHMKRAERERDESAEREARAQASIELPDEIKEAYKALKEARQAVDKAMALLKDSTIIDLDKDD